jgi:hypothetical protein
VKWGYRCERVDLISSSDTLSGRIAHRRTFSVLGTFLRPLRRLTQRATRV